MKMYSTINDPIPVSIICTCGCKTSKMKSHLKSNRHRYMQAKKERALVVPNGQEFEIIGPILTYEPRVKKPNTNKKTKTIIHLIISSEIDFD
jgi:hypothetical protein